MTQWATYTDGREIRRDDVIVSGSGQQERRGTVVTLNPLYRRLDTGSVGPMLPDQWELVRRGTDESAEGNVREEKRRALNRMADGLAVLSLTHPRTSWPYVNGGEQRPGDIVTTVGTTASDLFAVVLQRRIMGKREPNAWSVKPVLDALMEYVAFPLDHKWQLIARADDLTRIGLALGVLSGAIASGRRCAPPSLTALTGDVFTLDWL